MQNVHSQREGRGDCPARQKFSVDKGKNCGKINRLNVMTELSPERGQEREGMVEALGQAGGRATPERPATSGSAHPRYRMT